jgi:GNAT superfamily N-acetyltransferase
VNEQAWPDSAHDGSWLAGIKATVLGEPERTSAYVAYADGQPVCASRIDFPEHSPFASLWGGATLERYRKRGIYTAMLATRAREAAARGYRFLTIDASPMSGPIAMRHGFRLLCLSRPCDSPGH